MIPFGGDSWTLSIGGDPDVEFCMWVLLRDGLHVPPFEAHEDGDRALRAVGLTESNWREWFESTVRAATHWQESVRADPFAIRPEDDEQQSPLAGTAAGRWPTQDLIRVELLRLWPPYMRYSRNRDEREFARSVQRIQSLTSEQRDQLLDRERRLWHEIQQFRPLPPLHFYTVDYPTPVVEIVPPASAVLGGVDGDQASEDRDRLVLEAAKGLKTAAGR